jgi:DNA-binding GntR family transcriptional regulator
MVKKKESHKDILPLAPLDRVVDGTIADQVFDLIQSKILTLEIPPRTKLSETEVAGLLGVSRQPVRESFKRLAKSGFLEIRPQSGTKVSLISEDAALRALYIRTALEVQTCRSACEHLDDEGRAALIELVEQQRISIDQKDRERFHAYDNAFHKEICIRGQVGFVWDIINETRPHMDRVRMISLSLVSQESALLEHREILDALCRGDGAAAVVAMRSHLAGILVHIENVKAENHNWFLEHVD